MTHGFRIIFYVLFSLFYMTVATSILRADEGLDDSERDTSRFFVTGGVLGFSNYPSSIGDLGPALGIGKPFWLGTRHRHFQWSLDTAGLIGHGLSLNNTYFAIGPQGGFNFYLNSFWGLEFRMGIAALAQMGSRNVFGVGIAGSGGYVFRFWRDDRKRLKLFLQMIGGTYFVKDPSNDLAMNASSFGAGIGYEVPF